MAGRPMADSSATVEAPERDITRWAAAMRTGKSEKNGAHFGGDAEPGIVPRTASRSSARACCTTAKRARRSAARRSIAAGTISAITRAPWLPPNTSRRNFPPGSGAA